MQVTETLSEGLKREFKVVVPAAELDAKVNERLDELKGRIRIDGFRPGKVPVSHLKRVYGRSAMAEVIEATVRDANNQIVSERGYQARRRAEGDAAGGEGRDRAIDRRQERPQLHHGGRDRAADRRSPISRTIKLTKLVSDVTDAEVDEGIARIAEQNKPYAPKAKAPRPPRTTASSSPTPAPSTASRSKAAPATTRPC